MSKRTPKSTRGSALATLLLVSGACPVEEPVELEPTFPLVDDMDEVDGAHFGEVSGSVLGRLHRVNRVVIEFGEYAKAMAASGDVRAYADRLVRDHERIDSILQDVGSRLDIEPVIVEPSPQAQVRIDNYRRGLVRAGGTEIDRRFLWIMLRMHQQVIRWLEHERPHVHPELAATIDRIIPILQQHLELGRRLLADLPDV